MVVNNRQNIDGITPKPKSAYLKAKDSRTRSRGITPGENPLIQAQALRTDPEFVLRNSKVQNNIKRELKKIKDDYDAILPQEGRSYQNPLQQYQRFKKAKDQLSKEQLRRTYKKLKDLNSNNGAKKKMQGGPFIAMASLAIAADILDLVDIAAPGVGTVVTIINTGALAVYFVVEKVKLTDRKLARFAAYRIIELIPYVGILPMETLTLFSIRTLENNALLKAFAEKKFGQAQDIIKSLN